MSTGILIDTDIVIDSLLGNSLATLHIKNNAHSLCFSAITVAEINAGIRGKKEESEVERFFSIFPIIAVTSEIARKAGAFVKQYRSSHSIEIPDSIVAATCASLNAELHTLNVKHYPMFNHLKPPYKKIV